jgi:hypothetical protein
VLYARFVAAQLHCNYPLSSPPSLHLILPHQLFNRLGVTALHLASGCGNLEIVNALVAAKSDLTAKTR